MIVLMRFNFSDEERRAVREHFGELGLATRAELRIWVDMCVTSIMDDLTDYCEKEVGNDLDKDS